MLDYVQTISGPNMAAMGPEGGKGCASTTLKTVIMLKRELETINLVKLN